MNFYLETINGTSTRLNFPIVPDQLNVSSGANTLSLNVINTGEAKIPRGEKATGYSWDGFLPGESMKNASFINKEANSWQSVEDIVGILEDWKKNGTPLKFVVGSIVNTDVFIETFNRKHFGQDHCKYSITLTKYPTLIVGVSPGPEASGGGGGSGTTGKVNKNNVCYRKGPGTKYKKLGTLKKGTTVTIYGSKGNWYKIKEGSPEWWISKSYVKVNSGSSTKKSSSSSSNKKSKKTNSPQSSTKNTGGKKNLTVSIPTSKRASGKKVK